MAYRSIQEHIRWYTPSKADFVHSGALW